MNLSRNIVIEASAGTGKTYTLVQTILQALFQKNLPMDTLVALTFTKKAAGEMKERIAAELETIDRAAIGTIHSYCFSLLKRFPLAAGINPDAEVDDKNIHGDDFFEREWPVWLSSELRAQNAKSGWLEVLDKVSLDKV